MKIKFQLASLPFFAPLPFFIWMLPCFATSFIEQPFPDTVQDAPSIVRGTILNSHADWGRGPDGPKRLYTYSELAVREVFKGNIAEKKILVRELGGEKDGIGMHVAGASQLTKGEDVVIMLSEKNSEGSFDIRGLMMGKYNVQKNQAGTEILVGPGIHSEAGGQNDTSGTPQWTLESLREIIRTQARMAAPNSNNEKNSDIQASPPPDAARPPTRPKSDTRPLSEAPQLQTSNPEEPKNSSNAPFEAQGADGVSTRLALIAGGLGVLAALAILRRRR